MDQGQEHRKDAQGEALALAEAVSSRLCHDVAGLVATIAGTLEMAIEDLPAQSEAASLAMEAATQLAARVRLYRAAWGGGDMEEAALANLADGLPNRSRLRVTVAPSLQADGLDAAGRRVLLCVLLAAVSGMPSGGDVTVESEAGGFIVALHGCQAAWPMPLSTFAAHRNAGVDALGARFLAAPMAALVAAGIGWSLQVNGVRLIARPE